MKAAMLGTQHHSVTVNEHDLLLRAGKAELQRMAGYIPARMPFENPQLLQIDRGYAQWTDFIMWSFGNEHAEKCNPRVPYLLMAWTFISQDNPHRTIQFTSEKHVILAVTQMLLAIALGYIPDEVNLQAVVKATRDADRITDEHLNRTIQTRPRDNAAWDAREAAFRTAKAIGMARYAAEIMLAYDPQGKLAHKAHKAIKQFERKSRLFEIETRELLIERTHEWRYISDDAVMRIARALMVDMVAYFGCNQGREP